jgi:RNA polymerase sigma factor (sigma-70 family)
MVVVGELGEVMVRAAVAGEGAARAHVLEVLAPRVRLMVAARLSPHPGQIEAVDELTQQALAALVPGLARLENQTTAGLRAYVSAIVTHRVAEYIRRRPAGRPTPRVPLSLDTTVGVLSETGPLWQVLSGSGTSPSGVVARAEQIASVVAELGRLRAEYREIITLAFFDQLPMREIARLRGTTQRAAATLLLRAVRTLRRKMTGSSQVR